MLGGSGAFSLDNALLTRKPALAEQGWFRWMSGALPLPMPGSGTFEMLALRAVFAATVTSSMSLHLQFYYRGSVIHAVSRRPGLLAPPSASPQSDGRRPAFEPGRRAFVMPISMAAHQPRPQRDDGVGAQVNDGAVLEQWDGTALSQLPAPASAIRNEFTYSRFAPGRFGLRAKMGAAATITAAPATGNADIGGLHGAATVLQLRTVNGDTFNVAPSGRNNRSKKRGMLRASLFPTFHVTLARATPFAIAPNIRASRSAHCCCPASSAIKSWRISVPVFISPRFFRHGRESV